MSDTSKEFKKIAIDLNIDLIKEPKEFVHIDVSISNGNNIKIEATYLIFRNDTIIYCNKLFFGVLSPYHCLNIETMHNISSYAGKDDVD